MYYYICHFLSYTCIMSSFMLWLHAHAIRFIYLSLFSTFCTLLIHTLFVYYTSYFLYTVFMYCSYTNFIYLYSCTVHFIYCFLVILFIWLSLLGTYICCHILSYDIHILCFSYTILFHILYFSYAFRVLCFSYTILVHILCMYYVFVIYCHIVLYFLFL